MHIRRNPEKPGHQSEIAGRSAGSSSPPRFLPEEAIHADETQRPIGITLLEDRSRAIFASTMISILPTLFDHELQGKRVPGVCPILAPLFGDGFINGDEREVWRHFFQPPDSPALDYARELKQSFEILRSRRQDMLSNISDNMRARTEEATLSRSRWQTHHLIRMTFREYSPKSSNDL